MNEIIIESGSIKLVAGLYNTPTANEIIKALPLEGTANVWGKEVYFVSPLYINPEPDAREEVEEGELAFWPVGSAFCIFFGPTPVSTGNKPRAYSPVNVFGRITGDLSLLNNIRQDDPISITLK